MFGESSYDRRDYVMGLAGLLAGLHSLRILAEKGLATSWDVSQAQVGLKQVLAQLPEGAIEPEQLNGLHDLITNIGIAAAAAEHRKGRPLSESPASPTPYVHDPRYDGGLLRRDALDDHGNLLSIEEYERKRDG